MKQYVDYAAVADVFIKSNATLPSSAAAEHLFNAAGQVLTAPGCRLADEICVQKRNIGIRRSPSLRFTVSLSDSWWSIPRVDPFIFCIVVVFRALSPNDA